MSARELLRNKILGIQMWEKVMGEEKETKIKGLIEDIRQLIAKLNIGYFQYKGVIYSSNPPLGRIPSLDDLLDL